MDCASTLHPVGGRRRNRAHPTTIRIWDWGFGIFLLAAVLVATSHATAQDRVVLRGTTTGRVILNGTIQEYLGTKLTLSSSGSPNRTLDAADVLELQTPQVEQHRRGLKSIAEGSIEAGLKDLDTALKIEERPWVRREILAEMVRAGVRINDYGSAGLRFKALHDSDPKTRHFRRIPLVWAPQELTESSKAEARDWVARNDDVLRLMGGSLLLDDASAAEIAELALREVSRNSDDRLRKFAQAQLWRKQLQKGPPGEKLVAQWTEFVGELPEELRAGPTYLLGRAHALRREHDLAAASFLWLPLADDTDHRLAARACLEAADALADSGRPVEAENLLQELRVRFPDTAFAAEAEERLKGAK